MSTLRTALRRAATVLIGVAIAGSGAMVAVAVAVASPAHAEPTQTIRCLGFSVNPIRPGELPVRWHLDAGCPLRPDPRFNAAFVESARDDLEFCTKYLTGYYAIPGGFLNIPTAEWRRTPNCDYGDGDFRANTAKVQAESTIGGLSVVNGASFTTPLTPSMAVAGFGANLSPVTASSSSPSCTFEVGNTTVYTTDNATIPPRRACMLFASPGQVNFVTPDDMAVGNANQQIFVFRRDIRRFVGRQRGVQVTNVAPAIFVSGSVPSGYLLRVLADGSQVTELLDHPIRVAGPGEQVFLVIYATGVRRRANLSDVTGTIAGITAFPNFAGPSSFLGVDQVNLLLPDAAAGVHGAASLVLRVGAATSNTVTVTFA